MNFDEDSDSGWSDFEEEEEAAAAAEGRPAAAAAPAAAGARLRHDPPPMSVRAVRALRSGVITGDVLKTMRREAYEVATDIAIKPAQLQPLHEPVEVSELTDRELLTYRTILGMLDADKKNADAQVRSVMDVIERGMPQLKHPRISGRMVDTASTKFHRVHPTQYYINTLDPGNPTYVSKVDMHHYDLRHLRFFDLRRSYGEKMGVFHKELFDPFARSREVWHEMSTGERVPISLCKYHFYMWAIQCAVFQFIDANYDAIYDLHSANLNAASEKKKRREAEARGGAGPAARVRKRRRVARMPVPLDDKVRAASHPVAVRVPFQIKVTPRPRRPAPAPAPAPAPPAAEEGERAPAPAE